MKKANYYLKLLMAVFVVTMIATSCEEEAAAPKAPLAFFTSVPDVDNSQLIVFTNETENGDSHVWDFGDASATSTEVGPSHEYAAAGLYTVKLTATNVGGDNVYSEDITVMSAAPVNVLVNGELNDDSNWTVQQFNANNNGSVTFADGVVVLNEIVDIADGEDLWGEEAHAGMYQAIDLEAGNYIFDMDFITEGINETWCEVWIGTAAPVVDEDYKEDIGAVRIGLINAWDCSETNTYSGALSAGPVCVPESFELTETTTYYVVVRAGGFNFGPNGITIDNLSLLSN